MGALAPLPSLPSFPFLDLSTSLFSKFLKHFLSFPLYSSSLKSNGQTIHREAQISMTRDAVACSQILGFHGQLAGDFCWGKLPG